MLNSSQLCIYFKVKIVSITVSKTRIFNFYTYNMLITSTCFEAFCCNNTKNTHFSTSWKSQWGFQGFAILFSLQNILKQWRLYNLAATEVCAVKKSHIKWKLLIHSLMLISSTLLDLCLTLIWSLSNTINITSLFCVNKLAFLHSFFSS